MSILALTFLLAAPIVGGWFMAGDNDDHDYWNGDRP